MKLSFHDISNTTPTKYFPPLTTYNFPRGQKKKHE